MGLKQGALELLEGYTIDKNSIGIGIAKLEESRGGFKGGPGGWRHLGWRVR